MIDNVNNPKHYTSHPSGVQAIEITRWLRGPYSNACKYVMRGWDGLKGDPIEDLQKSIWYLNDAEKYPDYARRLPDEFFDAVKKYAHSDSDANKVACIIGIINAAGIESGNVAPIPLITGAKKLIQDRIAYLQSRPDVAL